MNNNIKIQKVSKVAYGACIIYLIIGFVLTVAFNAWLFFDPDSVISMVDWDMNDGARSKFLAQDASIVQHLIAQIIGLSPFLISLYGVWRISQLFKSCRQGAYFTAANASHLFVAALMMVLSMLLGPVARTLTEFVLFVGDPDGSVSLSITLSPMVFQTLFVSCTFMAFSWIMLEGKRIAAENEGLSKCPYSHITADTG